MSIKAFMVAAALTLAAACGGNDGEDADASCGDGAFVLEDLAFPGSFTVAPGETIEVENRDNARHSVTSDEADFDVEVAGNECGELTVPDEPGDYEVVCRFHRGMQGTLTVEE